jgi:hypothetical protein
MLRKIGIPIAAAALMLWASSALPASAVPVRLWLQPNSGFGFDAPSVSAAQSTGVGALPDSTFFSNPASGPQHISITTPPSIPGVSIVGATLANPSTGTSTWTVTAVDRANQDLWIVIQGHDPNDANASYYNANEKIGLVIDPTDANWRVVHPAGFPGVSYLAYRIGDLAQNASFDVPISYVVAQALMIVPGSSPLLRMFPQYRVNFLELVLVPEPVLLSLLAFGGAALAMRKRQTLQ